ncbi:MAG: ORF6N domain-containing protein, partial [Desulfobacterales bacterium]|nr:ORF6N domain-containing protein [Desulfobacterales bacterium]
MESLVPIEIIEKRIFFIRGHKVMLDNDLAELYDVETFNLNKAVKRNIDRFPSDFMFQITRDKMESLKFQFGISKTGGRGGRRYLPYAFTEQGVAMLSGILNSQRAVHVNIAIMRTFVKLRELLVNNKDLAHKLEELERKIERHDEEIRSIFQAIRQLMTSPEKPR